MASALDIYQDHLDRVSNALWLRDMEALLSLLAVPNRMGTEDGELVYETEAELRRAISDYRNFLDRSGAQDYHRIARHARFVPGQPGRIDGEHDTIILRGGHYVLDPFSSAQVLVLDKTVWRGVECRSRVRNATCTILNPTVLYERARHQDVRPPAGV